MERNFKVESFKKGSQVNSIIYIDDTMIKSTVLEDNTVVFKLINDSESRKSRWIELGFEPVQLDRKLPIRLVDLVLSKLKPMKEHLYLTESGMDFYECDSKVVKIRTHIE